MAIVYIGIGSNVGDREHTLQDAHQRMGRIPHAQLLRSSRWHETAPVGVPPQGKFLNGVTEMETSLPPSDLLAHLQRIEQELGRPARHDSGSARTVDLDLLAYDSLALREPDLEIPHPRMHQRPFVLIPMAELAPDWKHPLLGRTIQELIASCRSSAAAKNCAG